MSCNTHRGCSCKSFASKVEVKVCVTGPMPNRVFSVTGLGCFKSVIPYPRDSKTRPLWTTERAKPGIAPCSPQSNNPIIMESILRLLSIAKFFFSLALTLLFKVQSTKAQTNHQNIGQSIAQSRCLSLIYS